MDREPTLRPSLATPMGEAKEVKRVGTAFATLGSSLVRRTTELDQACLAFVSLQAKLREPLPECFQARSCFGMTLEADHEIIHESNNDYIAAAVIPPPPFNPQVEYIVQIHVTEQR